ncbi:helix-turn-helix domain-containing protein [Amycolatopsis sp. PS_44_ISF1]|uniref:helix-turn-helix domain-containing protein n=1 Tax=Amycolatopsis sp. PS_44_ISF1 TaxID=2974917 RepID=UPI0028DF7C37|nr:helix-turn-helix domain-containing protein [Amycolatopsis sp. PS_44_ISF1]MDT8915128.1 helix-turn-helix domain-containing protein [Amycolatopsis sp. PS_44_ISF1]
MTASNTLRGKRITGQARSQMAADLKRQYEKGASIRVLAQATDRSYGFIHQVLRESGVVLRGRGGDVRRKISVS